jgi:SAM-dependent methyltransferase
MAYRLILGREPENERVIEEKVDTNRTLSELRRVFLESPEFAEIAAGLGLEGAPTGHKPLIWPPIDVQVSVPPPLLDRMVARIEREFVHLGETEPHWSVISEDRYKANAIASSESAFFESGAGVVGDFRVAAARHGIRLDKYQRCFELGCGLGRSTVWLAKLFPFVVGADISSAHLALARGAMTHFRTGNVDLLHLNRIEALDRLDPYDVLFSIIVLQHNPPPLMARMLSSLLAQLRPGGVAYFQVPTYIRGYRFNAEDYLSKEQTPGVPEMHALPQAILFDLVAAAGCSLVEIREDDAAGPSAVSNRVLLRKPA